MEQLLARMQEIRTNLVELHEKDELTEEDSTRFEELSTEFDTLEERRVEMVERAERMNMMSAALKDPRNQIAGDDRSDDIDDIDDVRDANRLKNPWDYDALRTANFEDTRARAVSAVEEAQGFNTRDREVLTEWLEDLDPKSETSRNMARHIVTTSAPDYTRSWMRAFKTGATMGTPDPEAMQFLARAMSLTDNTGGYAIPQQLDPALILTSDGSTNAIRQISRHVIATGDTWTGLSTTHASWSNDAEATEVSDDSTTFAQPSIPVHKAQVFIPFSLEIEMDYPGFTMDLREIIANGKDDLDASNFATGTGTNQPTGIVTALAGGASEVASATTDTFASEDVYALESALPAKYRGRAQWTANKSIYNAVRQFDTAGSQELWARIGAGQPAELVGYGAFEASGMDGTVTATADNYVLILGDWRNYVIADRIGMTLELVPHLFATANNLPSGQRGFYGYARTGADSVNDGGFRMLNVT